MMKCIALGLLVTAACVSDDDRSVAGTWRAVPNAFDDGVNVGPDLWTFRDDGTVTLADADEPLDGHYELDGDRMRLSLSTDGETLELDFGIVLTAERLLVGVLFPEGDVDGAVGTWSDTFTFDGEEFQRSLVLAADGTAIATYGDPETGTWEEDGESIALELEGYREYWFRIDERGVGDALFERVE